MPSFKLEAPEKRKQIEMEKDESGRFIITTDFLRELCETNGQYATPKLNDTLYLHYKGFEKIQNLEKYENLKTIWLECNGILKIGGLESLTKLRMVYLHQNAIKKIEGLNHLKNLVTLNLSNNQIIKIENLAGCDSLRNLDLGGNLISSTEDCQELTLLPALGCLDLKNNQIEDSDNIVPFF